MHTSSITEIMSRAKDRMSGNWGMAILTSIVYGIITGIVGSLGVGVLIMGHFSVGMAIWSLNLIRNNNHQIENLFDGFKNFVTPLVAMILNVVIVFIGFLLLFIPGIIAGLGLSMTYYIIADQPKIDPIEAIKQSWEMMKGNKTRFFVLGLYLFLLGIACIFTLGIGFFFLIPYAHVATAEFYQDLKGDIPSTDSFDNQYIVK